MLSELVLPRLFSPVKRLTNFLPSSQPRSHLAPAEAVAWLTVPVMKLLRLELGS
ncbi:hypothetical protein LC609_35900 [Nostoc sp. XA013]|nr:hypothetical protein [Nostoc sp. XA013]